MTGLSLLAPAWHRSDSTDALQRARLRLAPLATRAVARAAAVSDSIAAYADAWSGHDSASLRELACTLGGYADALEDAGAARRRVAWPPPRHDGDAAQYTQVRRAWALVSGLASLQRAIERRAAK